MMLFARESAVEFAVNAPYKVEPRSRVFKDMAPPVGGMIQFSMIVPPAVQWTAFLARMDRKGRGAALAAAFLCLVARWRAVEPRYNSESTRRCIDWLWAVVAMVLAVSLATATHADDVPKHQVPWLLGDLSGYRTTLLEKGIDIQLVYVTESAYNAVGGTGQLADYTGQVTVGTTFDLERILGMHDATFEVTYTERAGRNLSDDANLGTFQLVQEVWGRGQTVRLTQMFFEQKYFDKIVSWKAGRTSMGSDFAVFPCDFQNLTFCGSQPGNVVGGYIFNWPISQWGSRVKVNLDGFGYYQVGVYDQNQQYLGYDNKLWPVWYWGSTGVLVPVEVAWEPNFFGKLDGSYKFGGWYSSGQQPDAIYDKFGNPFAISGQLPAIRAGLYGGYVSFQQQITRTSAEDPKRGLRLFFNAAFADTTTSSTDRQIAGGFWYTGPFAARPNDVIAFAMGTTHQNERITQVASLENLLGLGPVPVKDSEYVFELDYTFVPKPGLIIRPNLQYVYSPGGNYATKDVFVLGLKTIISF
ncbi:MAG: carbohydrate porin [Alphaproteobacteria bacterium]|nr:carbohydrate porin [Alphaproteobacteria bacterium]